MFPVCEALLAIDSLCSQVSFAGEQPLGFDAHIRWEKQEQSHSGFMTWGRPLNVQFAERKFSLYIKHYGDGLAKLWLKRGIWNQAVFRDKRN